MGFSVAVIAGQGLGADEFDDLTAAEVIRQRPSLALVDPHQRRLKNETSLHAQVECDLQGLDRVVAAVRITGIVRLAYAGDHVLEASAIGDGGREGQKEQVSARHKGIGQA
ncbi:hypothetical protein D3C80_1903360 [compost metagenome]